MDKLSLSTYQLKIYLLFHVNVYQSDATTTGYEQDIINNFYKHHRNY